MSTTEVPATELAALSSAYPGLPAEYFTYLSDVGWGEAASGRMIYNGPVAPQELYGDAFSGFDIVLLGDDFQGYCFGYDLSASIYGEVNSRGIWEAWPTNERLSHYVEEVG
jgi:hypothetical protein